jgi:hypothetical protein
MWRPDNPVEVEPERTDPLPKDADGKTIVPTQQTLDKQLERLRRIQQAEEQLAQRRWSQR